MSLSALVAGIIGGNSKNKTSTSNETTTSKPLSEEQKEKLDSNVASKDPVLDLSRSRIKPEQLQGYDLSHVVELNLSLCGISKIAPHSLATIFPNLKKLNLHLNRLAKWPKELNHFQQLEYLCVDDNAMYCKVNLLVKDSCLFGQTLRRLDLSQNKIKSIPIGVTHCKNLEELNLSGNPEMCNNITPESVSDIFSQLLSLKLLNMSFCGLESFRLISQAHKNLEELQLKKNKLGKQFIVELALPSCPYKLSFLELSECELVEFPQELCFVNTLKHLNLTTNKIQCLPDEFIHLQNLEELKLGNNQISSLPPSFDKLEALQLLNLKHNSVNQVEDLRTVFRLRQLQKLNLKANKISALPVDILCKGTISQLASLNLGHNKLDGPFMIDFSLFPRLSILKLNANSLTNVSCSSTCSLLNELNVQMNCLSSLPYDFSSVKKLNAMQNKLLTLDADKLCQFTNLTFIILDQNELNNTELVKLKSLPNIKTISIKDNDILEIPLELNEWCKSKSITLWNSVGEVPSEILPGLYLSSFKVARNKSALKHRNITHILTVARFEPPYPNDFCYKVIAIDDKCDSNLSEHFTDAHQFIDSARKPLPTETTTNSTSGVLVHCAAGISRSATIVISYVMREFKLPFDEALNLVAKKRPVVFPNGGFREQLRIYEESLLTESLKDTPKL